MSLPKRVVVPSFMYITNVPELHAANGSTCLLCLLCVCVVNTYYYLYEKGGLQEGGGYINNMR